MLRIVKFLALLAIFGRASCFFDPLSLLLDTPIPLLNDIDDGKLLVQIAEAQASGDLEDWLISAAQLAQPQQQQQQQHIISPLLHEIRENRQQQQQQQLRDRQQRLQLHQQQQEQLQQQQQRLTLEQLQRQQDEQQQQQRLLEQQRNEQTQPENEQLRQDFDDLHERIDNIKDKMARTLDDQWKLQQDQQERIRQQEQQLEQQQIDLQQRQPEQQQLRSLEQREEREPQERKQDLLRLLKTKPVQQPRLIDDLIDEMEMQSLRMLDVQPIISMRIDTIDAIDQMPGPFGLLNQLTNSFLAPQMFAPQKLAAQNPFLSLAGPKQPSSCDQVQAKLEDGNRENRIRIQHTVVNRVTYRFESSTCQCAAAQREQKQQREQFMRDEDREHCSLAYSRPDQQHCKLVELGAEQARSNCEAVQLCRVQGEQCDGVYHDGAKFYLVDCVAQSRQVASKPGLGAEYIIQLRNCF